METKHKPVLTSKRIALLYLLADWRFFTTDEAAKQYRYTNPTARRQLNRDLEALELLKMIEGFRLEPELGQRSRKGWLLLTAGAREISLEGYGSQYRRKPTRERVLVWEMERELIRQVKGQAHRWSLITPGSYNNINKVPAQTEQSRLLIDAAGFAEYSRLKHYQQHDPHHPQLNRWIESYKAKLYESDVPKQENDFVASCRPREGELKAVVFILYDPRMTELFWKSRIKEYEILAKYIPVFGVFARETDANTYKEMLKAAGLRLTLLTRIGPLLQELEAKF